MKSSLVRLGIVIGLSTVFALPIIVKAATTINSPTAGCFQAGTAVTLAWTQDSAASGATHSYASIWQGTSQPTYANGQPPIVGGHFAVSPLQWTPPAITTTTPYKLYAESHASNHSNVSTAESAPFNTDASIPTTPVLSPGATTDRTANITWTAATDDGCEGLRGYKVYRDGSLLTSVTGTSLEDAALAPNTEYSYSVEAYDDFAASPKSNTVNLTTKPLSQQQSTNTTTTTIKDQDTRQLTIDPPTQAPPVQQLDLKAPVIDNPDTSKIPKAVSPSRLSQDVTANTKPKSKPSNAAFYAVVGLGTILGGVGVFTIVNRFAPKL